MTVSVVIITYAHEKFIRDTIVGVLMQKCDFPVELIVSNDASPDKTDEVIRDVINNYSGDRIIRYTQHKINLGMMGNFLWALNQAKGKYIALCEGDDYWTDFNKLQTQVDFLEANSDYAMCYHPVEIIMANERDHYAYSLPPSDTLYLNDIIREHYIPTCSLVFRNGYFSKGLPTWMLNSVSGDIPLEILLAANGKTKYISKIMACYRRNEGGISQSQIQLAKMRKGYIYMYSKLASDLPFKNSLLIYRKIIWLRLSVLKALLIRILK